jgi:hypothetical protein
MKDQELYADRFSAEVDRMLEQQGRAEDNGPPSEYGEMLALAERLANLDFSHQSTLKPALRRRLLDRIENRSSVSTRSVAGWRRLFAPRPRRAWAAAAALALLVLLMTCTPAGKAVAQAVEQFVQELRWSHTTLQQFPLGATPDATIGSQATFEEELAAGRAWEFSFEGRSFAGCCSPEVRNQVVSLEQAKDEAGFGLHLPTVLPAGFVLEEIRLLDVPPYMVFVIYGGSNGRLGLEQSLVGITSEQHPDPSTTIVENRSVSVVTDGTIDKVMVGETPAALIDGESLVWESDRVSYRLIGPGLGEQTLIRVAESLAPVE